MQSSNPILTRAIAERDSQFPTTERMSIGGTVNKTAMLLAIAATVAAWPWGMVHSGNLASLMPLMWASLIGGVALTFAIMFRPHWAMVCAPLYAACEGVVLGTISALMETRFPGIALQAMVLTFGVLGVMLLAYKTGLIRPSEKFMMGIVAATGGIAVIYLASIVAGFFGASIPFIHSNGMFCIGFSVAVSVVAALNLVLDFAMIERGAAQGAPKYMEWYGAFGLMVTLVWLYLEVLRLLSKLRSR